MKKKIILTFPLKKETGKMLFHVTNNRASPFTLRSYHRTIVSRSRGNKGEKKKKNKKRRGGGGRVEKFVRPWQKTLQLRLKNLVARRVHSNRGNKGSLPPSPRENPGNV